MMRMFLVEKEIPEGEIGTSFLINRLVDEDYVIFLRVNIV